MKCAPFEYHRPETVGEAVELLAAFGDDAKVLAGGQSLLPIMALRLARPAHLIDIARLTGLPGIEADANGVTVGALVRHVHAERSTSLAEHAPLVHQAMPSIGHRAIRTRGTVCGSIAHADPAAELPAVALAADATVVAVSKQGRREIAAADFFVGYLQTVLRSDELVTEVRFPPWVAPGPKGSAVVEVGRRHGDYALVGLACSVTFAEASSRIADARLVFFGAGSTPVRLEAAETAIVGDTASSTSFARAAAIVAANLSPAADVHASASYRKHLAGVLTQRGLEQATANAGMVLA